MKGLNQPKIEEVILFSIKTSYNTRLVTEVTGAETRFAFLDLEKVFTLYALEVCVE